MKFASCLLAALCFAARASAQVKDFGSILELPARCRYLTKMIRVFPFLLSGLIASGWAAEKPNLLLFLADDMTYTDLGCYGNPDVKTPAIDQLATEGMKFTRCYNSAPTCSPLRQSLYTGLYPVRNGAHPNHSRVYAGVRSIPHYLEPLGYRVAIVGKRHEAPAEAFPFESLGGVARRQMAKICP